MVWCTEGGRGRGRLDERGLGGIAWLHCGEKTVYTGTLGWFGAIYHLAMTDIDST